MDLDKELVNAHAAMIKDNAMTIMNSLDEEEIQKAVFSNHLYNGMLQDLLNEQGQSTKNTNVSPVRWL